MSLVNEAEYRITPGGFFSSSSNFAFRAFATITNPRSGLAQRLHYCGEQRRLLAKDEVDGLVAYLTTLKKK